MIYQETIITYDSHQSDARFNSVLTKIGSFLWFCKMLTLGKMFVPKVEWIAEGQSDIDVMQNIIA